MNAEELEAKLKQDFPELRIGVQRDSRFVGCCIVCSYNRCGTNIDLRGWPIDDIPYGVYRAIVADWFNKLDPSCEEPIEVTVSSN